MSFFYTNIKKKINNDKILRNIILVSSGTALAQIIKVASQPIITRVYTPEEYGLLSVFTSLLLIFRFSTLRYEIAIPIAPNEKDALNLIIISLMSLISVTIVIAFAFYYNGLFFLNFLGAEGLYEFRMLIPIGILLQGLFIILTEWMYRLKNYKIVTQKTVIQSLIGNFTKIILGFFGSGAMGLIFGVLVSVSSGTIPLALEFKKSINRVALEFDFNKIKSTAFEYSSYPIYQTPSSLAIHVRNQLPIIFFAAIYGSQVAGLFGLANSMIKLPMTIVGQSVMNVFFAEIASIGKNNPLEIKRISNKLLKQLVITGLIPITLIVLFGPFLFEIIFGSQWIEAGVYARILSIYIFPNFIFTPISRVYEVFNKQSIKMMIDIVSLISLLIVFLTAYFLNIDKYVIIFVYSVVMLLMYLCTYLYSLKIINNAILKLK